MIKSPRYIRIFIATISLCLSLLCFTFLNRSLSSWISLQLGPNIAHVFAHVTFFSIIVILSTALITLVFGRIYCTAICPLGILQDFTSIFVPSNVRKKNKQVGNYPRVRYLLTAFTLIMLASGSVLAFELIEPYSNFGRIASTLFNPLFIFSYNLLFPDYSLEQPITSSTWIIFAAVIPLLLFVFLVFWKRRIFCTTICPVGTLLGLCSKFSLFKLSVNKNTCIKCNKCKQVCPVGCINIKDTQHIDNERCVMCTNCLATCPVNAVDYKLKSSSKHSNSISIARRDFILGGAAAITAIGAGRFSRSIGTIDENNNISSLICPPGAGSPERFISKCTNCNLCIPDCEGNVIKPANIINPVVHLEFDKGVCEFNCKRCIDVCPTGALRKMDLQEKQLMRIGMCELNLLLCIVITEGTDCSGCSEVCPTGALYMNDDDPSGKRIPRFISDLCIGCGNCEFACPARPVRAIKINPVSVQVLADAPESVDQNSPTAPALENEKADSDEWLF